MVGDSLRRDIEPAEGSASSPSTPHTATGTRLRLSPDHRIAAIAALPPILLE